MTTENGIKHWIIVCRYQFDGHTEKHNVTTEIQEAKNSKYGNGKAGGLTIETERGRHFEGYDLRYEKGDLHKVMIEAFYKDSIISLQEA